MRVPFTRVAHTNEANKNHKKRSHPQIPSFSPRTVHPLGHPIGSTLKAHPESSPPPTPPPSPLLWLRFHRYTQLCTAQSPQPARHLTDGRVRPSRHWETRPPVRCLLTHSPHLPAPRPLSYLLHFRLVPGGRWSLSEPGALLGALCTHHRSCTDAPAWSPRAGMTVTVIVTQNKPRMPPPTAVSV